MMAKFVLLFRHSVALQLPRPAGWVAEEGVSLEASGGVELGPHPPSPEENFAIRSSLSEPPSAPCLVFADGIELLHLWLQRI